MLSNWSMHVDSIYRVISLKSPSQGFRTNRASGQAPVRPSEAWEEVVHDRWSTVKKGRIHLTYLLLPYVEVAELQTATSSVDAQVPPQGYPSCPTTGDLDKAQQRVVFCSTAAPKQELAWCLLPVLLPEAGACLVNASLEEQGGDPWPEVLLGMRRPPLALGGCQTAVLCNCTPGKEILSFSYGRRNRCMER